MTEFTQTTSQTTQTTAGRARRSEQLTRLDALHAEYVERINSATQTGREDAVDEFVTAYDTEATQLVAEHEGLTHLLPLQHRANARVRRTERFSWLTRFDPFGTSRRNAA